MLYIAADEGQTEICQLLLDKGANINHKNNFGHTALQIAVEHGNEALCNLLIERGADLESKS